VLLHLQLDLCSILLGRNFSRSRRQLDKDFLPRNENIFNASTISILLLLGIRVFNGSKLLRTCCRLNIVVLLVGRRVISLTDAPIRTLVLIRLLQLHLPLPMEPTLFLLLPSRTMFMGGSIVLL
jgi:hypothetical protein